MDLIKQIKLDLSQSLSSSRFKHIEGVALMAKELATTYGACPEKAELAGWLHDIAKEYKAKQLLDEAERFKLNLNLVDELSPHLLHARVGAQIAKEKYSIIDTEILSAIEQHTLGKPRMSILEQILFVADAIEPTRKAEWADPIRNKLKSNGLNVAIVEACKNTIHEVITKGHFLHPLTVEAYNFYLDETIEGKI